MPAREHFGAGGVAIVGVFVVKAMTVKSTHRAGTVKRIRRTEAPTEQLDREISEHVSARVLTDQERIAGAAAEVILISAVRETP